MDIDIRNTIPPALAPISFDISQPQYATLSNGLRVVIFEDERLPLVSFRLAFDTGDINDPADSIGIASAVASMLTEGTREYTSLQLAEKIERLGANISANASDDFTVVSASSLSLYSSSVLALLAEIILRPTFPESELDLYRRNTVEHLKFQRSQPGFLAGEQAARLIFGEHPYSRVSPCAADIEKLDRVSLASRHAATFVPNNALMIVVGDIRREEFMGELSDLFSDWERSDLNGSTFAAPPLRKERTLTVVDRPGSAQSNIVIGNLGVKRTDPDYFPLLVMNQVLGAGASSRVFMNLREEKGYTYGAYTRLETKRLSGLFEATAEVRTLVTGDSLKEFFYEFDRIRNERVADEELTDAKNFLTGVFPLRAETQEGLTNLIVNQNLYGLPDDYLQTYRDKINEVTAEEVERVAMKHIRPDEMAIVIVGDAEEVLPQVTGYAADVEVFDTEGAKQDMSRYTAKPDAGMANAAGKWELKIDIQGRSMPISLLLEQHDDALTGSLSTMLGDGTISEGKVIGNKISATAKAELQGQSVEFGITGKVDGNSMSGSLNTPMFPDALPFTGEREAQKSAA